NPPVPTRPVIDTINKKRRVMYTIDRTKRLPFYLLMLIALWFTACSNDDDGRMGPLKVISVKLNNTPLVDQAQNVSVNSTFEVVFSAIVEPERFESAFFITAGSENVPYTAQYLNQSTQVLITIAEMSPATLHTIGVDSGRIGLDGKMLAEPLTYTFTTEEANANTKTPCLSATEDCLQQLSLMDNSDEALSFEVYANYDFIDDPEFVWDFIEKVVVVVHGAERNAGDYFGYMLNSLKSMELEESTLVISPYFQDD